MRLVLLKILSLTEELTQEETEAIIRHSLPKATRAKLKSTEKHTVQTNMKPA